MVREEEREREADVTPIPPTPPRSLVASVPTNGRVPALTPRKLLSHDPAFPWLAGFHRASSFASLEYVGIRFIYFLFFPRGLSIAQFHFARESSLEHAGGVAQLRLTNRTLNL